MKYLSRAYFGLIAIYALPLGQGAMSLGGDLIFKKSLQSSLQEVSIDER
jgi:hypothetical protein